MPPPHRPPRAIAPAAPRQLAPQHPPGVATAATCFYDLPPELRVEIYKLVLFDVKIEITPLVSPSQQRPVAEQNAAQTQLQLQRQLPVPTQTHHHPHHPPHNRFPAFPTALGGRPLPAPLFGNLQRFHADLAALREAKGPSTPKTPRPHPIVLTTRSIRNEVLPIMHAMCPIHAPIVDFDFNPLLTFVARIPPDDQRFLLKNTALTITLTTKKSDGFGSLESMRKWLHLRADPCRPQPEWRYGGQRPGGKVANDLKRRWRRMKEAGKKQELGRMIEALGIHVE